MLCCFFFFQAEDGIRDLVRSRGLGDVYKRQALARCLLKPGNLILADEPTGSLDEALADVAMTEMLSLIHI